MTDGGPAFPAPQFAVHKDVDQEKILQIGSLQGMTLRDYFAAKAMQGMCANPDLNVATAKAGLNPSDVRLSYAKSAYKQADEMLKERSKTP